MKETLPPPLTVAMEEEKDEGDGKERDVYVLAGDHERGLSSSVAPLLCCGEEPATAVAMLLSVEVVVDEVEPHSVQVAYTPVRGCVTS